MLTVKPLFVTYVTDLGSSSLSDLYKDILKEDFDFFKLDMVVLLRENPNKKDYYFALLKQVQELRKLVKKVVNSNNKVIFQNLKPAMYTYGLWNSNNGIVISDFSHTLFSWYKTGAFNKDKRYYTQKVLYKKLHKVLTLTDRLSENLYEAYGVEKNRLIYVPLPLNFDKYYQSPIKTSFIPKVLFVGGEFYRKGGNYILDIWEEKLKGKCELIILTRDKIQSTEGITVHNNISNGDDKHIELFKTSDIFILPTNRDAYPVVLGEAAVSGNAIITTQYALGAKNIIEHDETGYVANDPKECTDYLVKMIENPEIIDLFKQRTNEIVLNKFSKEKFKEIIIKAIK